MNKIDLYQRCLNNYYKERFGGISMNVIEFYQSCLNNYYNKYFGEYAYEIQWCEDPADNTWKFYIPSTGSCITLICDDYGFVTCEKCEDY